MTDPLGIPVVVDGRMPPGSVAIVTGPGPAWIIPEPKCPVHGQMRENFARDAWTCAGFDGEGCDHVVRNEDRELVQIAVAGPMTIKMEVPWPT